MPYMCPKAPVYGVYLRWSNLIVLYEEGPNNAIISMRFTIY